MYQEQRLEKILELLEERKQLSAKEMVDYFKVSKDANKLIEEFMLLANRTVAEFVGRPPKGKTKKTFVYRIHELPDPDKNEEFRLFYPSLRL